MAKQQYWQPVETVKCLSLRVWRNICPEMELTLPWASRWVSWPHRVPSIWVFCVWQHDIISRWEILVLVKMRSQINEGWSRALGTVIDFLILTVHHFSGLIKGRILCIIKWDKIHNNFLCSTEFIIWQLCNLKELNSTFHADFINLRTIISLSVT